MQVNTEKKDELNAILTVNIEESDYQQKVDKVIKDYRRNANIPGFRKGHVPVGLIRKQYGKAVLIEEVNKILQEAVFEHIQKQEIDILGNPMPIEQTDIDWDQQKEFSFSYELGLAPEFDLNISARLKVPYYKVVADKEMVDRYVMDYGRRFGTMTYPEKVEENALLKVDATELTKNDEDAEFIKVEDITLSLDSLKDKVAKKLFGLKASEKFELKTKDFEADFNLANLLNVDEEKLKDSSGHFKFEIREISKLEPAELNQELFDKIFGEGAVSSEEEFRARIKEDAEKVFVADSDRKFYEDVKEKLLDKTKFELPETFLKKWMQTAGEKPMTADEVEEQFPQIKDSMRWQLVENRVIKEHKIEVSHEELVAFTKQLVMRQMAQYGQMPEEADLEKIAHNVLGNKDEAQRINDQLYQEKLIQFFKDKLKVDQKELTYEEFIKKLSGS